MRCVNPDCRFDLEGSEAFCPYCGADNRAPEARELIQYCGHPAPQIGLYCRLCGAPVSKIVGVPAVRDRPRGLRWLAVGVVLWLAAAAVIALPATDVTLPDWARGEDADLFRLWILAPAFIVIGGLLVVGGICMWRGDDSLEKAIEDVEDMPEADHHIREFWN